MTGSAIGTYLHGPVLPRNPALADHMIHQVIRRHELSARHEPRRSQMATA